MSTVSGSTESPSVAQKRSVGWVFLSLARIGIGFVFLWAFLDKLFGLGYGVCRSRETGEIDVMCDNAWVNGGHVTEGYLANASGPMGEFFQGWADIRFFDWVFMIGLLGVGLALILGIGTRIAALAATAMLVMMYLAAFDNSNNPFMDDHIIYSLAVIGIVWVEVSHQAIGLGSWWKRLDVVQKNRWLI